MELRTNCALPQLPALPAKHMAGPTPFSNWVIPGQVIAGAYPASIDDLETERLLTILLELGINTFVCLQAEVNIHIPEHAWRAGMGLRPYIKDAQRILSKAQETNSTRVKQRKIDFLHLPIIDGSVTTDLAMSRLADDCCERALRGECMYIHCWGGHGRTGTLVATMLGRLYSLPYSAALRYTQGYHDTRVYPQGVRSPQTAVQRAQVRRLLLIPSHIPAMAVTAAAGIGANTPTSTTGQSTAIIRNSSSSNLNKNIALGASSSSVKESVTATHINAASSPVTPVKQNIRSLSSLSSWTLPVAATSAAAVSSRVSAPASIGMPSSSSNTMLSSTSACRGMAATKRTSSMPGGQQQYNSIAGGNCSGAAGMTARLIDGSVQQKQCAPTAAALAGSSLLQAAAARKGSTSNAALLQTQETRSPVHMTTGLSRQSMLKRAMDVPA